MVNATSKSSRMIGYYQLHPYIIPLPSTMSLELTEDDELIILANPAFWACISHEEAVAQIRHISDSKMAASKLRDMALAYGNKEEISVIVIYLLNSSHLVSRRKLPAKDGEDEDSPLLRSSSHLKHSSTTKLSRPKTFHGEADLQHYSTASLGRVKEAATTGVKGPTIKHTKSVKELYSKPAAVEQQPKIFTSSRDDSHISTQQDTSPQTEVKKKPLKQNKEQWEMSTKNNFSDHRGQKSSVRSETSQPTKQAPFVQSQIKHTSHDPQLLSHDPKPSSRDPKLSSHDPKPSSRGPKLSSRDPKPSSVDPKLSSHDPKLSSRDPKPSSLDPKLSSHDPKLSSRDPKPSSLDPKPSSHDPKLSSRDPKPSSLDPKPSSHDPKLSSRDPKPSSLDTKSLSRDPKPSSLDPKPSSHDFPSLSHSSSHSTVADQDSAEAQSLNESANPTWFESLPPMQFGDIYGDDTFGLELGMLSETMPTSTDSNVVLGRRSVDQGWGGRSRSYTAPQADIRATDQEQAKANFNFDELLAGLDNAWMTSIPPFPEDNNSTSYDTTATKSTMKREDSLFLDNSTLMEQFDQPVNDKELNDLITQLSDFVNDTS